jgi:hypothetical protein
VNAGELHTHLYDCAVRRRSRNISAAHVIQARVHEEAPSDWLEDLHINERKSYSLTLLERFQSAVLSNGTAQRNGIYALAIAALCTPKDQQIRRLVGSLGKLQLG